jgi:CheY-like chemotaxis protein
MSEDSRGLRVLLADDNEDDVVLIQEAFRECPHVRIVGIVPDGGRALDFLQHRGEYLDAPVPQLVLLDINMPGKNGFETLRAIKHLPGLRHLPVAILTTSSRDEDVRRTFAEGACSFITKPSNIAAFRRVASWFERYWTEASRLPAASDP